MDKIVSYCGVVCSECVSYPKECKGCQEIKGSVYWLQYTGESVCEIYDCCINKNKLAHCGKCRQLPCDKFDRSDPTKTPEENAEILSRQLKQLNEM